ncbi:exosortase/archaeosortase family protein [Streptomyces sp. NPDC048637]|uniref:exosortase/archaeosortase family protein n=1 Tax=Streptomyces sp. NPDC048637 TaxID=3155636 RepID=UPI00343916E6
MDTLAQQHPAGAHLADSGSWPARTARWAVALCLLAASPAVLTVWAHTYRSFEALAAGKAAGLFTSTIVLGDAFHVPHSAGSDSDGHGLWIAVTAACTTTILLVPLVLIAAWAVLQPRIRPAMALLGLAAGLVVLLMTGTARLAGIGLAWHWWGARSFWLSHNLVGSLISLIATVVALGVQFKVTGLRSPAARRSFGSEEK